MTMTTAAAAMIELDGVAKSYGDVHALRRTDLSIAKGEFVTLLGPSGSGKSTLLNLIAGMIAPSAGRIVIDGRDATTLPTNQRGLGMVFQNYALMPHMTVFENIAFPLQVRRLPKAEIRRKVAEALDLIQLGHVADRRPRELSGGQQQRVSLARCIVYNPALILMDEPLGALDKKLREQMQLEIKRLHAELGITMLYVTHDQDEALTMSDRIVLMNGGRIEQQGTPDALYFKPETVFLGRVHRLVQPHSRHGRDRRRRYLSIEDRPRHLSGAGAGGTDEGRRSRGTADPPREHGHRGLRRNDERSPAAWRIPSCSAVSCAISCAAPTVAR